MTGLVQFALSHLRHDHPFTVLDAAAADGSALVALADRLGMEARYAGLELPELGQRVLSRLRGADDEDRGAQACVGAWAARHGAESVGVVAFGEPLSFSEPVQGALFGDPFVPRPPATFGQGPFDLVIADVPRRILSRVERARFGTHSISTTQRLSAEVLFVERLLDLVVEGGALALRMRAEVVRRQFGRSLVATIDRRAHVVAVERDGSHILVMLRLSEGSAGAMLLRALGSQDAAELLQRIHGAARGTLVDQLDGPIGATSTPGCDDVWEVPRWLESQVPTTAIIRATDLRDWSAHPHREVVWPYDEDGGRREPAHVALIDWLARFRKLLEGRVSFGRTLAERDVRWFEYVEHHANRWGRVPAVVIARNGVYPRVAVLRKPAVVSGGVLLLIPQDERAAYLIAGVLGSSLGTFWMKHTFHVYETERGQAFEVTAVGLSEFPIPADTNAIISAARALDRLARSMTPLHTFIDGEAERLDDRLRGARDATRRLHDELARLQDELDLVVISAFGLGDSPLAIGVLEDSEYQPQSALQDLDALESDALLVWLIDHVHDGFATGGIADDRPVGAEEVADWIRLRPLARAVLRRSGRSVEDLLSHGAVPLEPWATFSASGLAKLRSWGNGQPRAFSSEDYASCGTRVPPVTPSRHRRRIWRWRGRYNVPRERFVHLVEISEALGRPLFGWAGASEAARRRLQQRASAGESVQVDLERCASMLDALASAGETTMSELADGLLAQGWCYAEVEMALAVLQGSGAAGLRDGRWSAR